MVKEYNFDSKSDGSFTVNNGSFNSAASDRVYDGSYSGSVQADTPSDPDDFAVWQPWNGTGKQASEFEFYFQESSSSYGSGVRLKNSNGNYECGFATNNPQWNVDDSSGITEVYGGDGYDRWIRVSATFDWSNSEFTVTFEDLQSGTTKSYTGSFINGTDIAAVELHNYNSGNWHPADNPDNTYMWWDAFYTTPVSPPSAPSNLALNVNSNDSITASWDPPSDWGGEKGNYHIQLSRDAASYVDPSGGPTTPASGTTSATYNSTSDVSYDSFVGIDSSFQFRVRAENSAGSSSWTQSGTVYTDPIPPHSPFVDNRNSTQLNINWSNRTDIFDHVEIQYRKDTGSGYGSWKAATTDPDDLHHFDNDKYSWFEIDARYQFRLRTVAPDGGTSKWVYADYGNEGNVYFKDDFEDQDLSEWSATDFSGGGGIYSGSNNSLGISGADQGSYYVRLDGSDYIQKNLGDISNESDVFIKSVLAVGSFDADSDDIHFEWYDGSSWQKIEAGSYSWEYNRNGWVEAAIEVPDSLLSTDNRIRIQGDEAGGGDYVAVDHVVVSDIVHEYTKPAAPTSLSLDTSIKREVTASWVDNASVNTKYEAKIRPTGSSTWTHKDNLAADLTTYTFTGLLDGEKYDVFSRATAEQARHGSIQAEYSADSSTISGTTILPPPSRFSASIIKNNRISASWTDNSNNEDGFRLMLSTDGGSTFSQQGSDISANKTSFTTSDLLFNQNYVAKVRTFTEHTASDSGTVSLKTGYGLQYYNSSFSPGTVKIYDGDSWVRPFKVKRFDGSQWD
ncbi:MAG: fibronectin type III domain-containing protein [Candidatus Nanohalobium sp.]